MELIDDEPQIQVLNKAQAALIRMRNPNLNPWRVLGWQALAAALLAALSLVVMQRWAVMLSVGWGGLCVVLPGAVFARALSQQMVRSLSSGGSLAGLMVWELVKVVLTVVLLLAAPRVVFELSWLALLAGFVVTIKVHWVACYWEIKRSRPM